MSFDFTQYSGTRVRCQRIEDAKLISGWVHEFTETGLRVGFDTEPFFATGDRVAFEMHGPVQNVFVIGESTEVESRVCDFKLTSNLRLSSPTESVRVLATRLGVFCELSADGVAEEVEVVDVSSTGVGVVGTKSYERGTLVELRFETLNGSASGSGEVRYARQLPHDPTRYRIGLRLQFDDRVSRARWGQLFPNAA